MDKKIKKEVERIEAILKWIPGIKQIIRFGGKWEQLKGICEPLGLTDTAFRDYPRIDDYLIDELYWETRLAEAKQK